MGCDTDALAAPTTKKCSFGQAISYGLLVACLVLLLQTAFCLIRAQTVASPAQEGTEVPVLAQRMLSLPAPVVLLLAGALGTALAIKEILLRRTPIKLLLNLVAALALVVLFALALQAVGGR
jgi:hypothetical protein